MLADYQVIVEFPLHWGDMDAFQHVNNARYLTYFESARLAYMERIGFLAEVEKTGIGPILARVDCRFRIPLAYPDTVRVGVRVTEIGSDRFIMAHCVVSERHGGIAAEGNGLIVSFDYRANRKSPIPAHIRERIEALDRPEPLPGRS